MTDNMTGPMPWNRPAYLADGGDADSDQQEMPGESIYDGMFALDHVSGSQFVNSMAGAIGQSAVQFVQKAVSIINPEAGAAWAGAQKLSEQFTNVSSTLGKILRIRGRLPNLDPHVYGDDGPLSTARTGQLFNFAEPLKQYVGNQVFPGVAEQLGLKPKDNSDNQNDNGSGVGDSDGTPDAAQSEQPAADPATAGDSLPDIGQLASTAWKNAVRDVSTFSTPKLTVPTGPLGSHTQVDKSFTITTEWPVSDPLIKRDRRNDAALAFLPRQG
ncbi:hypothetical protein ACIP5Y_15700 [Nocardia sp. NPDC088792]|uniref:hypothetical protein n=1 Tax=Nocardia sp. NPDC088792 TaxID=3364332 RepID=UPI003808EFA9